MAFKMKYSPNKKTGEGFPYKGEAFKYDWLNKLKTKASDTIQMLTDLRITTISSDDNFLMKKIFYEHLPMTFSDHLPIQFKH